MSKIKKIRIISAHIDIGRKLPKSFELKVESSVMVKTPKDDEEKNILLTIESCIAIPEKNEFEITIEADVVFELEQIPEDYAKYAEQQCIPIAQEQIFNKLDEILVCMGYKKLELAKKLG